ncbi:hypothetical protein BH09ACT10_BH09ACT10_03860 [soil metagenome]
MISILRPHSYDAADSIGNALASSREATRAVKISLGALGATALIQLGVVLMTSSVAPLADTIHNFSDALTAVLLGIAYSSAAVLAGYKLVLRLVHPRDINQAWVVLVDGPVGFVGNEFVALCRICVGR